MNLEKKIYNRILKRLNNGQLDDKKKVKFWEVKNVVFESYLPKVSKAQIKVFKNQEKRVMTELGKQKHIKLQNIGLNTVQTATKAINANKLKLNIDKEVKLELKLILPILEDLFEKSGDETFKLIGIDMNMDVSRPEIQKLLKADCRVMAKGVTEVTNANIVKQVTEGLKNDEGYNDIQKRIQNVFKEAKTSRAKMIANTETARYNSNANEQAFKDSGVVKAKQWQTQPGACPQCAMLQGKIISLGKNFLDKGDKINDIIYDYMDTVNPPLHPRCKCDLVPVFK